MDKEQVLWLVGKEEQNNISSSVDSEGTCVSKDICLQLERREWIQGIRGERLHESR